MARRRNKRRKPVSGKAAVARNIKANPARDESHGAKNVAGHDEAVKNKSDASDKEKINGKSASRDDKAPENKTKTGGHANGKNKNEAVQETGAKNKDKASHKAEADNGSGSHADHTKDADNAAGNVDDADSTDGAAGNVVNPDAADGDVAAEADDSSDGHDSNNADGHEEDGYPLEPGQEVTSAKPVAKPSCEPATPPEERPVEEAPIEELSIKTTKVRRGAKLARILLIILLVLVVVLALTGVGMWGYNQFRPITVSVNGAEQRVSANTSLGKLAADHDDFGAKPGKLLSVSGKVLKRDGGGPVRYTLNGKGIGDADAAKDAGAAGSAKSATTSNKGSAAYGTNAPIDLNKVKLPENAKITVKDGKNFTEKHDIQRTMIPFGVNINGHGVIQKLTQKGEEGSKEVWTGKISGEKVDKGVVKEPKNVIVDTFSPKPATHKVVALTFDDGPSQYSGPILDILKEKGAKATFFDVGNGAAAWPQYEQRMVAEGHQVASHSYSHPDMYKLSPDQLRENISQGLSSIKSASGVKTKMLRAPYGNFGPNQWLYVSDLIDYNVIWTIDTKDWKKPGAPEIANAALSKAYNGAVILMHDGGGDRSEDIAALPGIIDGLKGQGYEFVTIDQLMAMDGK